MIIFSDSLHNKITEFPKFLNINLLYINYKLLILDYIIIF